MPDQDQGPSLELPSFGLRRRKKAQPEEAEPASETDVSAAPAAEAPDEPVVAEPTQVLEPVAAEAPEADRVAVAAAPAPSRGATKPAKPPRSPKPAKPARQRIRWIGAAMVGLLSGFALVGLINATLRACDAARGTASCGGPGLFVLFIILVLITLGATRLLRFWGFPDSGTVAFLGIALTAIVALVFLTAHLLSLTMVLVIPLITAFSFVISDWISVTMSEADQS